MEKRNLAWPMAIVCFLLAAVICYDWVLHCDLVNRGSNNAVLAALIKYHFILQSKKLGIIPMFVMVRIFFVIALPAMYMLSMSFTVNENEDEDSIVYWHMTTITTAGIIILGFNQTPYLYDIIIFPIAFLVFWLAAAKTINAIRPNISEDITGEISCLKENEMSFEFRTDKGLGRIHSPQQGIFIEGGAGSGKCLAKGTLVRMFDGSLKEVEQITVNELVMGPDSTPRKVLALSSGIGQLYRVKQSKAEDYIVNENHILSLKKIDYVKYKKGDLTNSGSITKSKTRYTSWDDHIDIPIKDFINSSKRFQRCFLGYLTGIHFPEQPIVLDPYFLGLWLGDGDKNNCRLTNMEPEIIDYLKALALTNNLVYSSSQKAGQKAYEIRLGSPRGHAHRRPLEPGLLSANILLHGLKYYNLIANKHIPQAYITNSREVRLQLLAGLIDTDGYQHSGYYEIIQKSYTLAQQIQSIASSLGFRTVLREKQKQIKAINFVGTYYQVSITGFVNEIPVRVAKKQITSVNKNKSPFVNTIKVEDAGIGEYYGFELDGDHRFLLKDGTVTHNSASIIESLLNQACNKGYAGFIYDFKGNPPTLTKTVYNTLAKKHAAGDTTVKFAFMNFVDLTRTVRANPISPKYLLSDLHVTEAATTLMLNLNKSWIEKRDFWADNAISILDATIRHFRKHHPEYCTLPHVITAILTNYKGLLNFLSQDEDIKRAILPVIVAHESNAGGQTAGAISSIQLPLNKLYTPEVFWVLGADEFDLDITNKNNPRMLCVANDPRLMEALAPCIALVASCCMQQMNQQGKNKSIFCVDELPTIYIHKLDNLPATARSNKVVTCLSVQSYAQLERDYGKSNAEVIVGNLGNQFIGMTNENRTAERVQRMFGEKKFTDYSYSESDSGTSRSQSVKKENIFQLRDIMGQAIGHFSGKIAGGEPPLFSAQFPYVAPKDGKVYLHHLNRSKETLFEDISIPAFALATLPMKTGDENLDAQLFAKQVSKNFERIKQEIKDLLEPFQPQED